MSKYHLANLVILITTMYESMDCMCLIKNGSGYDNHYFQTVRLILSKLGKLCNKIDGYIITVALNFYYIITPCFCVQLYMYMFIITMIFYESAWKTK